MGPCNHQLTLLTIKQSLQKSSLGNKIKNKFETIKNSNFSLQLFGTRSNHRANKQIWKKKKEQNLSSKICDSYLPRSPNQSPKNLRSTKPRNHQSLKPSRYWIIHTPANSDHLPRSSSPFEAKTLLNSRPENQNPPRNLRFEREFSRIFKLSRQRWCFSWKIKTEKKGEKEPIFGLEIESAFVFLYVRSG